MERNGRAWKGKTKNRKSENSKIRKIRKSKNSKIRKIKKFKNQKIQNFRTRGLTPRSEDKKSENLNHAIFSGRESHYPHAPSNGIVMMDKRHCCRSSMWSSSIRSVRFTTLFWNQSAFHLNGLFSSFESTGNTHHGFWFTPRGIQCKYPWWNLSAWCKYLRANQCKYPCHFTTWCKYPC